MEQKPIENKALSYVREQAIKKTAANCPFGEYTFTKDTIIFNGKDKIKEGTMTKTVKHTATPFKKGAGGLIFSGDRLVAKCDTEANAQFIVKAVNNHYQLVEALKVAIKCVSKSQIGHAWLNAPNKPELTLIDFLNQALKSAQ